MSDNPQEITLEDLIHFTEDEPITADFQQLQEETSNPETPPEDVPAEEVTLEEEPTEETPEEKVTTPPETSPEDTPSEDEGVQAYYDLMKDSGYLILPDDYEFTPTKEGLEKATQDSYRNMTQQVMHSIWDSMDGESQNFLRYKMTTGGSFDAYVKEYSVTDLNDVDTTSPNTQKALIREYLKSTTSYTQDKIEREIARYEASNELETEAEDALQQLKTLRETKREKELSDAAAQVEAFRRSTMEAVSTSTLIPDQDKKRVSAFMHNEVSKKDGVMTDLQRTVSAITQNPEHYAALSYLLYDYDQKNGFNLDRWGRLNKTKGVTSFQKNLESALDTRSKITKSSKTPVEKTAPKIKLDEFIELFD